MSTKTVTAVLTANVSGFTGAMAKASASAQQFGNKFSASVSKNEQSLNGIARGAGLIGVGIAAGIGVAVKKFADFDSAMSNVSATGADAKANLKGLTDVALELGAKTSFSANEAAEGLENMLKAGISAKDSMSGLSGVLDLAAAGELSVGEAAELAATAMTVFKLEGTKVGHVADLLAAGAGKAQGSVHDMGGALNQSALVASTFGLSVEETVGSLSLFAKAGLTGSDAGTSFKTALQRLYAASGPGAEELANLGIKATDAAGAFLPMADVAEQLKTKLGTLSDQQKATALTTIFGSDAIRVGAILMDKGAAGVQGMTNEVNDFGYASRQAAERLNNLNGDLEGLSGAFDSAMIGLGKGANGPLRTLVQGLTGVVNAFNDLSDGAKGGVLAVAGVSAAGLLAAAGLIKIVTAANAAKVAMLNLGITAKGLTLSAGAIGVAIAVAAAAFVHFAGQQAKTKIAVDGMVDALERSNGAIDKNIASLRARALEESGALVAAQKLGISIDDITKASLGNAEAQGRVNVALAASGEAYGEQGQAAGYASAGQKSLADAAKTVAEAVGGGNKELALATEEYNRVKAATDAAAPGVAAVAVQSVSASTGMATLADGTTRVASGFEKAVATASAMATSMGLAKAATEGNTGATKLAADALDRLVGSMFEAANAALALSGNKIAMAEAARAATKAFEENGKGISLNTEKGTANRKALDSLASSQVAVIAAQVKARKSTAEITNTTIEARDAFVAVATKMTGSAKKANQLADSYGLIPKKVMTDVREAGAAAAKKRSDAFKASLDKLPPKTKTAVLSAFNSGGVDAARRALNAINGKTATTYIRTVKTVQTNAVSGTGLGGRTPTFARAGGGLIYGPGTATSDSIPAMLSNGEFVIRAAAVKALGVSQLEQLNAMGGAQRSHFATGGLAGFAAGGKVNVGTIMNLITAISNPLKDLARSTAAVTAAQKVYAASVKAIAKPKAAYDRASGKLVGLKDAKVRADAVNVKQHNAQVKRVDAAARHLNAKQSSSAQAARVAAAARALSAAKAAAAKAGRAGKVQAEDGSWVNSSFYGKKVQAEDGSWVSSSFYGGNKAKENADKKVAAAQRRLANERAKLDRSNDGEAAARKRLAAERAKLTRIDRDNASEVKARNVQIAAATRAKSAAADAYTKAAARAKVASDALKESQAKLAEQQKAVADTARQVAEGFMNSYRSQSTDAKDWIDLMRTGASDIGAFTAKIAQLRSAGLNEALVQQIIGMGATAGSEIATQIARSGSGLVNQLNSANASLTKAADALGYKAATGVGRYASGGMVSGPGSGTSDSINARLSNGEYVVNAAATAANRGALDAINYGRTVNANRFVNGYAHGGFVRSQPAIDVNALRSAFNGVTVQVENPWTGEYHEAKMKTVAGSAIGQMVGGFTNAHG